MKVWITTLWLLLAALASHAAPQLLEGKVTRVTDGDSLWVEPAAPGAPVELRLEGIDAPEICQAWGAEARQALSELVLGKEVSVKTVGRDTHGRTLGTLYLATQNINKLMVQEGHAWSTRYKYDRGPYVADERMARALSRGFNRAGGAVMPRDFRQLNGPCHAPATAAAAPAPKLAPVAVAPEPARLSARCDGRKRCSQMRSCEEATWFLKNCPGMEMDGDGDGVPCERQWCSR
jgi:endonuclease YncB( thermonuclease family)